MAYVEYGHNHFEASVYYNHETEADQKIIAIIQQASKFVYFSVYTFTLPDIKDALLGAKHRGLKVAGIVDKNQLASLPSQKKIVAELERAGIPIETQNHSAIMHMKVVVTDNGYVSGSYNWTAAATNDNDEVIEVGHSEGVRRQYERVVKTVLHKYAP